LDGAGIWGINKMRILGIVALCVALAGCQTAAQAPATASGKPEVTIKATTGAIKARLLSLAMDRRFNVTKDTEYLLQIEKPTENMGAAILLGSKYDSTPAERIVFTFAPMGDSVRVVAASMFVTNPGSAFEQLTPINAGEGIDRTQAALQEIKTSLETPPPAPPPAQSVKHSKPKSSGT
jgi:apolipoprotein N-acyltransferase